MSLAESVHRADFILIVIAMSSAGLLHMLWLSSRFAQRFSVPIDGGRTLRGHRIFGPNKTWKGLCALPFAAALSFFLVHLSLPYLPQFFQTAWWNLTGLQSAGLGLLCGLGFMLAELPNSFLKRQCDIPSGTVAQSRGLCIVFSILDRCDSILGLVLVLWCLVPIHSSTLLALLVFGPAVHALFSLLQFQLGLKGRAL